nr:sortase B protein-sorting domain-containing protein [Coprococcus sp. AF102-57]
MEKADTVTAKLKDDSKSPQTGDTSNLALWIALLFVSSGAAIGTTVVSRKKKYNR